MAANAPGPDAPEVSVRGAAAEMRRRNQTGSAPTTRQAILDAALELFAAQGYAGTSVRALTRAVGIRESSLYNHFENKEALFTALVEMHGPARSAQRLSSATYRALADNPIDFCRAHAADVLAQWSDPLEQKFQQILAVERERLRDERLRFSKAWFEDEAGRMQDYFEGFASRNLIDTPDPRECARLFMAGLTFIRLQYFLMPDKPAGLAEVEPQIERYLDHFFALIRARAG